VGGYSLSGKISVKEMKTLTFMLFLIVALSGMQTVTAQPNYVFVDIKVVSMPEQSYTVYGYVKSLDGSLGTVVSIRFYNKAGQLLDCGCAWITTTDPFNIPAGGLGWFQLSFENAATMNQIDHYVLVASSTAANSV
jgi:hypothetical protein